MKKYISKRFIGTAQEKGECRHLLVFFGVRMGLCAALGANAMQALAQSSVTLYGIADGGVTYTNNAGGKSAFQATSGGRGSSRWGLRSTEDLGGGTSALFQLENGFNMMTGANLQNSREFGRMAIVGLKNRFGQVTLGRQDDVMVTYLGAYSASVLFGGSMAAHAGDLDNTFADYKFNNTIKFSSQSYHGLSVGGLYGVGGIAGSIGTNQVWGLGTQYLAGPVSLGAVFHHINNPAVTYFDASTSAVANTTFTNPVTNPIFKGYTSAASIDTYGIGGAYVLGRATLAATLTRTQFNAVKKTTTTPVGGINPVLTSAELIYKFKLTPSLALASSFAYTKAEAAKYEQLTLGSQYALSKSTSLYVIGAWQHASGTNSMGQKAVANLNLLTASTTANQLAVRVGLQQSF
ncbi:putative porin [Robbsia andropogonis]|nr:porin [Robbsia andropogonis]MCP1119531.1 porin [Robbsia andropogonis]MCP1129514.1 porin [Robbsia andropogonis]